MLIYLLYTFTNYQRLIVPRERDTNLWPLHAYVRQDAIDKKPPMTAFPSPFLYFTGPLGPRKWVRDAWLDDELGVWPKAIWCRRQRLLAGWLVGWLDRSVVVTDVKYTTIFLHHRHSGGDKPIKRDMRPERSECDDAGCIRITPSSSSSEKNPSTNVLVKWNCSDWFIAGSDKGIFRMNASNLGVQ